MELGQAFPLFKRILEHNNRALETIADMGETMGGDYLFDINYIKHSYATLSTNITSSMNAFAGLTRDRYNLHRRFDLIDSLINSVMYETGKDDGELVVPYRDVTWSMALEVGGKNYHLSELSHIPALNVPPAFAVTSHAYNEFMRHNGLLKLFAALGKEDVPGKTLAAIREAIVQGDIPPALDTALDTAINRLKEANEAGFTLAVRSSAEDEDGEYSFAGQFLSVLNVPPVKEQVEQAYKEVLASLFSEDAVAYQKRLGYIPGSLRMPVACVTMVDAVASGVVYTESPDATRKDTLMITASWGLGESVVQGGTEADVFFVTKTQPPELTESNPGAKAVMTVLIEGGGTATVDTPDDLRGKPCLGEQEIMELAQRAMEIERYYRRPQDIEWTLGRDGKLYILQSRSLALPKEQETCIAETPYTGPLPAPIMSNTGFVVQKGVASGPVFLVKNPSEAAMVPQGAVLVAKNDSPQFIRAMPHAVAIITDTGSPASHMASLCREFRIPTLVSTGNATHVLRHGQEITLHAEDDRTTAVYDGRVPGLLDNRRENCKRMEELYEFRQKKYIMKYISPLNLVDPLVDEFAPEKCKTMHDILRFMHEKSVQALIDTSMRAGKSGTLRRLELPVPAGIRVIDIGGGLAPEAGATVRADDVLSIPFQALILGMTHPGAWHTGAVPLQMGDILTSIAKLPSLTTDSASMTSNNIAVVSKEYVNLSLKFGYHFNLIDCYLSDYQKNNHIYFRFVGGATDISKRSRRIRLLEIILREFGFDSKVKGDLIVARISNIPADETMRLLDQAGRLIAFTRQLDAALTSDASVETYARNFLEENYTL